MVVVNELRCDRCGQTFTSCVMGGLCPSCDNMTEEEAVVNTEKKLEACKGQVRPEHYNVESGETHWDMMWRLYREAWFIGNMTKYQMRYRKKDGLKDLYKARTYLEKLISLEEAEVKDWEDKQNPPNPYTETASVKTIVHIGYPAFCGASGNILQTKEPKEATCLECLRQSHNRKRTKYQVRQLQTGKGGCCERFGNNQSCDCLEKAIANDEWGDLDVQPGDRSGS